MGESRIRHCTVEECPKYATNRLGAALVTCSFQEPINVPYGEECLYELSLEDVQRFEGEGGLVPSVS